VDLVGRGGYRAAWMMVMMWLGVAVALPSDRAKVNPWVAAVVGMAAAIIVCLVRGVDA
jgi:hypothetical protein